MLHKFHECISMLGHSIKQVKSVEITEDAVNDCEAVRKGQLPGIINGMIDNRIVVNTDSPTDSTALSTLAIVGLLQNKVDVENLIPLINFEIDERFIDDLSDASNNTVLDSESLSHILDTKQDKMSIHPDSQHCLEIVNGHQIRVASWVHAAWLFTVAAPIVISILIVLLHLHFYD